MLHINNLDITAHITPHLTENLLSIPEICEKGATVTFDREKVSVKMQDGTEVQGPRTDKGYHLQLDRGKAPKPSHAITAQLAMRFESTNEQVKMLHATMGSPPWQTFIKAIDKLRLTPSGLTKRQIKAHPQNSIATSMGHLDQTIPFHRTEEQKKGGARPVRTKADLTKRRAEISVAQFSLDELREDPQLAKVFVDACGEFKHIGKDGSKYILVFYSEIKNYIHFELLSSRGANEYTRAYKQATKFFTARGCPPIQYRFDHEYSETLVDYLNSMDIDYQLFPPGTHRANIAERMIRCSKNHIISSLCTTDPSFDLTLWCYGVPQWEITINLLRQGSHPQISAYEDMMGKPFDWEAHPMAPFGTKVVTHDKPENRKSWDAHGQVAYYVGPNLEGYRQYKVWVTSTNAMRSTDTVAWHSERFKIPACTPIDHLAMAIEHLAEALHRIELETPLSDNHRATYAPLQANTLENLRNMLLLFAPPESSHRLLLDKEEADKKATNDAQQLLIQNEVQERVQQLREDDNKKIKEIEIAAQRVKEQQEFLDAQRVKEQQEKEQRDRADAQRVKDQHIKEQEKKAAAQQLKEDHEKRMTQLIADRQAKLKAEEREIIEQTKAQAEAAAQERQLEVNAQIMELGKRKSKPSQKLLLSAQSRFANAMHALSSKHEKQIKEQEYNTLYAFAAKFKDAIQSEDKEHWLRAADEELCRLIEDTHTMHPIKDEGQRAVYYNPQIKLKMVDNKLVYRVRGTAGGNVHSYDGPTAAKTASMPTVKILLNSVISDHAKDKITKFMTMDIKDFYLNSTLDKPVYMRIKTTQMSPDIIRKFKLNTYEKDGSVLFKIVKGIYGLPEAGLLAQKELKTCLAKEGYEAEDETPCLFTNKAKTLTFTLVVDDFGVKYKNKEDVEQLISLLQRNGYTLSLDWTGSKYLGFHLDWQYTKNYVDLSLPGYVKNLVEKINYIPSKTANSPGIYTPPSYGNKVQFNNIDNSKTLDALELLTVQRITGSLLYYSRAVDPTMLTAINKISTSENSENTLKAAHHLLNYANTWDNAVLRFHASDMKLIVYSDGSYLGDTKSRSRQGGIHYLGSTTEDIHQQINAPVECISSLIRVIVGSAAEAEYGALYENAVTAEYLRTICNNMGYPQHATTIYCDNTTAIALSTNDCKEKRTKAIDKDFHWIRCRIKQGHFTVKYKKGKQNLADLFTKLLPPTEHHRISQLLVNYPQKTAQNRRFLDRNEANPKNEANYSYYSVLETS